MPPRKPKPDTPAAASVSRISRSREECQKEAESAKATAKVAKGDLAKAELTAIAYALEWSNNRETKVSPVHDVLVRAIG